MRLIKCFYELWLRVYPADVRALFAAEMLTVFARAEEQGRRGAFTLARFVCMEYLGLLPGAALD